MIAQDHLEKHSVSWDSLLLMGSSMIDQNPSFSAAKVHALKKIVERLPESIAAPSTPRTLENAVTRRRQLAKFGDCKGQPLGQPEKITNKMPRVKVVWESKFANQLPKTPRKRKSAIRDLHVDALIGGIPAANPTTKLVRKVSSPRTPRNKISCRHCKGAHWSHRCPNKIRKEDSFQKVAKGRDTSLLSEKPPTVAGPKKKKYKFDFKVRKQGFQRRNKSKWVASPRYTN